MLLLGGTWKSNCYQHQEFPKKGNKATSLGGANLDYALTILIHITSSFPNFHRTKEMALPLV